MNILKNMEIIFLVSALLGGATSYATAANAAASELRSAQVAVEGGKMAVVKISAKRLAATEHGA